MTTTPDTFIEPFDPAKFTARLDALLAVFAADRERFAYEQRALARAGEHLKETKAAHAEAIEKRDRHARLLDDAHRGGAVTSREWKQITARQQQEHALPDLDEAEKKHDQAEAAFWRAVKIRERELAEQAPQS